MENDKPKHYCGLYGVYNHDKAAELTYYGLHALQHRGEESAGIVVCNDGILKRHAGMGLVTSVFSESDIKNMCGKSAIGHNRYSTTGSSDTINAQPILVGYRHKRQIALAHNGNLTNSLTLRSEYEGAGSIFQTTSDSEIILHMLARKANRDYKTLEALPDVLRQLDGAFSLLMLTPKNLIAARDPLGFRPLMYGKVNGSWIVASESCAFDQTGAEIHGDINPGEMYIFDSTEFTRTRFSAEVTSKHCIFEHVYFARPDSTIFGENVHGVRTKLGKALAQEHPANADVVIGIPDSGTDAAIGYANESGIPYEMGFVRNHYIGRTFIRPSQHLRAKGVEMKLNPIRSVVDGKRVVVVEDSVVRGTTASSRIKMIRAAGAKEVHFRVSCPPIRHGCYYGIDFPDPSTLIANEKSIEEIASFIGADSLGFLSLESMLNATNLSNNSYCTACFSGEYPVKPRDEMCKNKFEG